jgi:hypothetical protein
MQPGRLWKQGGGTKRVESRIHLQVEPRSLERSREPSSRGCEGPCILAEARIDSLLRAEGRVREGCFDSASKEATFLKRLLYCAAIVQLNGRSRIRGG